MIYALVLSAWQDNDRELTAIEKSLRNLKMFGKSLNPRGKEPSNKAVANVYSITGQLVLTSNVTNGSVNVSTLKSGLYMIKLSDNGSYTFVGKFIKK